MKQNKRALGTWYEERAAAWLESQGVIILQRNYRVRTGEIDLIGLDGEYLVFFEVKYRKTGGAGDSLSAVGVAKQRVISRTAKHYLAIYQRNMDISCRFDVIGIDGKAIRWIKNAFDYCE